MFETILLTGAAGTGKSTLARAMAGDERFAVFEYGAEIVRQVAASNPQVTQAQTRAETHNHVSAHHIEATDEALQRFVAANQGRRHVVIDSHAVTKERYGFRAAPFTSERLAGAGLSRIVVLHCEPDVLLNRIRANPDGRPELSLWEASKYIALQEALAIAYATICGISIHFLDCSQAPQQVRSNFLGLVGSPAH